jgi:hemin uptake protein HemP
MSTSLTQPVPTDLPHGRATTSTAQHGLDGRCRQLPSTALLQGGKAVEINHNGAIYRLQSTKLGKLILTK